MVACACVTRRFLCARSGDDVAAVSGRRSTLVCVALFRVRAALFYGARRGDDVCV